MAETTHSQPAHALQAALQQLSRSRNLTRQLARGAMEDVLRGVAGESSIERMLTLLHEKGETTAEIVGFAEAMRIFAKPVFTEERPRPEGVIADTCGTGGDGGGTFNISTGAAFVAAGAGVRVAKHGNRSLTSRCGSADVLEALGVNVEQTPGQVANAIARVGIGFLFAPHYHAATRHAQPVRKRLPFRTVFNLLGPLTNPAQPDAQVVGVFDRKWLVPMAEALSQLGVRRAFVVHSLDGLDEVSLSAPTRVAELNAGSVREYELTPEEFGLVRTTRDRLAGGDAHTNASILRSVFDGKAGPPLDVVLMNAAVTLVAAGAAKGFKEGIEKARTAVSSGQPLQKLQELAEFTRRE